MTDSPDSPRRPDRVDSLTMTRARHTRMARDLVVQIIASSKGYGRLALLAVVALVIGGLASGWLLAVGLAVAVVLIQVLYWWVKVERSMRAGLGVGQTITVGYASTDELTITDVTTQIWLPRGSALIALRYRSAVIVLARGISFVLPSELLTDGDIAFLEGRGEVPREPTASGPWMPLAIEMTAEIQAQLVERTTKVIATSADFLMPWVAAAMLLTFAALTRSWAIFVPTAVFCLVITLVTLPQLVEVRRQVQRAYPVGTTILAGVTPEHLTLATSNLTQRMPLAGFYAHRLTPRTVMLRRHRRRPVGTYVLPRALFSPEALSDLATGVPRRF